MSNVFRTSGRTSWRVDELVLGERELGARGTIEHLCEQPDDRLARRRVAEHEVLERRNVVRACEELADALGTVAAGAPDLLRVRLEALRQVVVVDVADVGLVDPHPEGDRRDHDRLRRAGPPLLHRDALLGAHAGVVGPGREAGGAEEPRDPQRRPLQRHVHDRRPGRTLAQALQQQPVALGRRDRCREQGQVRPVEAGHDRVRLLDPEPGADVGDDGGRGGGRKREHALGAELAGALGQLQVVGPEVVAPLRDAVRLVDREERDSRLREAGEEALVVEPLRRDVQELQRALLQPIEDRALLGGVEARIEPRGLDPVPLQEVDLVLHQRDQRRDHDRQPAEEEGRKLVAEALAGPGRKDRERRSPGEERLDDPFLAGPEGVKTESFREHLERTPTRG